jgi:hypothetical protein
MNETIIWRVLTQSMGDGVVCGALLLTDYIYTYILILRSDDDKFNYNCICLSSP